MLVHRRVNFGGRTLLHGPQKFNVGSVDLSPKLLKIFSKLRFKTYLAFTLNCVLRHANDLKTKSN